MDTHFDRLQRRGSDGQLALLLASPLTILPALASQALDPQGTGTIPAAEFLKSLAIFGGDNAFTPDEVRCTENSEPSLRP